MQITNQLIKSIIDWRAANKLILNQNKIKDITIKLGNYVVTGIYVSRKLRMSVDLKTLSWHILLC